MDKQGDTRMALVEVDLIPYMEDELWDALDNVVKKRLKDVDLEWNKLLPCLCYSISVNYYEEDITDAKEEIE